MGVFGFGNVGGAVADETTAGFPTAGLLGLYKSDESTGGLLKDVTGKLPPMVTYSGVALDCTANVCYINDGTFLTLLHGTSVDFVAAFEIVTPALVSTGTLHTIIAGSQLSNAPIRIFLTEAASVGASTNRFSGTVRVQYTAGSVLNLSFATNVGLKPSTGYSVVFKANTTAGSVTYTAEYREFNTENWVSTTATDSTNIGAGVLTNNSSASYQILRQATSNPFAGHVSKILIAQGVHTLAETKAALDDPELYDIDEVFGTTARYWYFKQGTGTACTEYVTGTTPTISTTGTVTWATGLSNVRQRCLRQGFLENGKPGIRLGGETGFVLGGKTAYSADHNSPILNSGAGWTVVAFLRVGDTLPSAERSLVSVYGLLSDGTEASAIAKVPGVQIVYTAAGAIMARRKTASVADATDGPAPISLGAGTRYSSNGVLTAYAVSCSSAGALKARRIGIDESTVTTAATVTADPINLSLRSTRVRIGDAALDCDLVCGFVAIYNREITDAELATIKSRIGMMAGLPSYVDAAAAVAGNGTSRFPYAVLNSALRVHQPNGKIYLTGGAANSRIDTTYASSSALRPASQAGMELIGTSDPVIVSGLGDTNRPPVLVGESATGRWIFRGITFDATDAGVNHAPGYTDGRCSSAAQFTSTGIERLEMYDCEVKKAAKADESSGTGLTARVKDIRIYNLTCTDNEEHGMYARINADSEAVTHTLIVDGFTCTGSGEDGLKVTNEFSDGSTSGGGEATRSAVYWDVDINDVHVTGGKNQLNLLGIASGYVTNCLLEGATSAPLLNTGAVLIGSDAYTGYESVSDVYFAHITIRDYNTGTYGKAINNVNSTGCTMINVITEGCLYDLYDPDGTLSTSYCTGNSGNPSGLWPTGNNNQPAATITFAGAGPGLADAALNPASDGYEDGSNLWTVATNLRTNLAGAARSEEGAWSRGAI